MTLHLYDLLEAGGGRVDYVWHVAGMPWAACTDARLVSYLQGSAAADNTLGAAGYSGRSVRLLTGLDVGSTQWSWTYDDAAGIKGGSHQLEMAEFSTTGDWSQLTISSTLTACLRTSTLWGVPGLSQVFDLQNDTAIPFGEVAQDISKTGDELVVRDLRGLWKYLDGISENQALLWVGHECLLATGWTQDADGVITINVSRGYYRTRPQPHLANEYLARSEYVCPVPLGGIVGRPSCLWAYPSSDDGATYGQPTLMLHGRVSQGIVIRDGVARVQINSPLSWYDSPSAAADYAGQLRRYVLQRGDLGTSPGAGAVYGSEAWGPDGPSSTTVRSPHLLIREVDSDGAGGTREQIARIWLCSRNSAAIFDTPEQLRQRIQEELDALYAGAGTAWEAQTSGDGTTGDDRQTLWHRYVVMPYGIVRADLSVDTDEWWDTKGRMYTSQIGGSVGAYFGLIFPMSYMPVTVYEYTDSPASMTLIKEWRASAMLRYSRVSVSNDLASAECNLSVWGAYQLCTMDGAGFDSGEQGMQFVPPLDFYQTCLDQSIPLAGMVAPVEGEALRKTILDNWFPVYFYEFGRLAASDYHEGDDISSFGSGFAMTVDANGDFAMYLEKLDGQIPQIGASIYLGNVDGMPRLIGTLSEYADIGDYYEFAVSSLYNGIAGTIGFDTPSKQQIFQSTYPCLGWIRCGYPDDPWAVSQGASPVEGVDGVDLLRAALDQGDATVAMAASQTLYWVPETKDLSVTADYYDFIDFDDLEERLQPIADDERYIYRAREQKYWDTLLAFARSHGLTPCLAYIQEANYDYWCVRWRSLGVISVTDAVTDGRRIDDSIICYDADITRDVASGYTYSGVNVRLNYDREDFGVDLSIADKSAYAQHGYSSQTYTVEDRITHCPSLVNLDKDPSLQALVASYWTSGILPHISRARPVTTAKCVARALTHLPVGADVLVTDAYGRNPFTAEIGYEDLPGIVTSLSCNLGTLRASIAWRLARAKSKGWAPALYCPTGSILFVGGQIYNIICNYDGIATTCAAHAFSGSNDMFDAARFDCWDFNRVTKAYTARDCSCGDYKIKIFPLDDPSTAIKTGAILVESPTYGPPASATIVLTLDSGSLSYDGGTYLSTIPYVVIFDAWDEAEQCQKDLYVAFCDDDGLLGTNDDPGDAWS